MDSNTIELPLWAFILLLAFIALLLGGVIVLAILLFARRNSRRVRTNTSSTARPVTQVSGVDGVEVAIPPKKTPDSFEIDVNKLRIKSLIGKGNFGEVWLATWNREPVAVKIILPKYMHKQGLVDRFVEEIRLMSILNHPNITLFKGASTKPPHMCLVLEYCVNGNLHDFLANEQEHGIPITLPLLLRFAIDVARGVHYLHKRCNIIQRDIKARNILIDGNLNAKVSDFGLSRILKDDDSSLTACGTPAWTAPEVVRNEKYSLKADVYSFGIFLWELITREEPFGGKEGLQIAYAAARGRRPEIPSFCPEDYAELMQSCWSESPDQRPTFREILKTLFEMKKKYSTTTGETKNYVGSTPVKSLQFAPSRSPINTHREP